MGSPMSPIVANLYIEMFEKRAINRFPLKPKRWINLTPSFLISRKEDGSISHQVYRKKTHTYRYLHANSHHFPSQKVGMINTLVTRALRISDKEHIKEEIDHLAKVFKNNGYSSRQFRNSLASANKPRKSRTKDKNEDTDRNKIFLPYIKGTIDRLAKTLKDTKSRYSSHLPTPLETW